MKRSRSLDYCLLPALALAALSAGCVGHNKTVFVTKSNAGLDFDTVPPTTEVTISRKEAVISPSFDNGQTPPVMASFKSETGHGSGFKSFFFGVDQTFAGGDAAIAMAQLYNSPETPAATVTYESGIEIAKPTAKAWWNKIPEPGAARPFLFATDTMFGLKIGWNAAAQLPDSVKAGFNRKEFAWAPLSQSESKDKDPKKVTVKSPSFLATVDSHTKTEGTDAGVYHIQYFATGRAATLLARQPDVRRAMLTRMDPSFKAHLGVAVLGDTMVAIKTIIDNLADSKKDSTAESHRTKLNQLKGVTLPATEGIAYDYDRATHVLTRTDSPTARTSSTFNDITGYHKLLEDNLTAINLTWTDVKADKTVTFKDGAAAAIPLTQAHRQQIIVDELAAARSLESLRSELTGHRDVIAAYLYVQTMISAQ